MGYKYSYSYDWLISTLNLQVEFSGKLWDFAALWAPRQLIVTDMPLNLASVGLSFNVPAKRWRGGKKVVRWFKP